LGQPYFQEPFPDPMGYIVFDAGEKPMNSMNATEQLSTMDTCWGTVELAHAQHHGAAVPARHTLLHRYSGAVHRYLFGAVRDPDVADELSQEFALRLLRGDFHRADRERGRFRDYIKSALINLVNKHVRSQQRRPRNLTESAFAAAMSADAAGARTFEDCVRDGVLARTWSELERTHPNYYAVLLLRAGEPKLSSSEMAERLTTSSGVPWKADQVRKILERARSKFADLLLDELSSKTKMENLYAALEELNLLGYCRDALERRVAMSWAVLTAFLI
jgi:RNA polymerase sigma factor (sigma-70 family)